MAGRCLILALLCACVVLTAKGVCSAGAAKFKSGKPLYGRIGICGKTIKILNVAFDESKGTGKGYDTLYVDTNFNLIFERKEALRTRTPVSSRSSSSNWGIPKLSLDGILRVPISAPASVNLYGGSSSRTAYLHIPVSMNGKHASPANNYSLSGSIKLGGSLMKSKISNISRPELDLAVQAQDRAVGLAMTLRCGDFSLACYGSSKEDNASFSIRDTKGSVIESGKGDLQDYGVG